MSAVFVEPCHNLPVVNITLAFRAGAVHDPPDRSGLARLTARMLRRGCRGFSSEKLEQQIAQLGGELGIHVGLTSTAFHLELLKRNIGELCDLLALILCEPVFLPEEFERLKRQTEAEIIDTRDRDGFLASRALRRNLFRNHPHAASVAGRINTVQSIERRDVADYHRQHYCQNNAIIAIAGDLTVAAGQKLGQDLLERLPAGPPTAYPAAQPKPPQGRNLVFVDKPDRSQIRMLVGSLGTCADDDDHTELVVANTAFGGTFTSRLVQEVRSKRGWSYGASSQLAIGRVRESFTMWTAPSASDAAACLKLQLDMLAQLRAEGISAEELAFCKDYLRRSNAFETDTARKRVGQRVERELLDLPADYHTGFVARVQATTLEGVNAAVRRRLSDENLWISTVGTEAEHLASLRDAAGDLASTVVEPYDLE